MKGNIYTLSHSYYFILNACTGFTVKSSEKVEKLSERNLRVTQGIWFVMERASFPIAKYPVRCILCFLN